MKTTASSIARIRGSLILVSLCLLLPLSAGGATISWGAPTVISGDTDVSTSGTFERAYNFGADGVPATTVNGVTFVPFETDASSGSFTVGQTSLSSTGPAINGTSEVGSGDPPFSGLSSEYQALLANASFGSASDTITLTLGGLTAGKTYQVQYWVNDSRASAGSDRQTILTAGNAATLEHNSPNQNGGTGHFVVGSFVADGTSQTITITAATTGATGPSPQINALQLRSTSEADCMSPPAGMLHWWSGDGHAEDLKGNRHGTTSGAYGDGIVREAFTGIVDVDVGDVDLPITFTIDAWINASSLEDGEIISKDNANDLRSYRFFLEPVDASNARLGAFVQTATSQTTLYRTTDAVISVGEWQHVAVTYDGNAGAGQKLKFYLNGVSVPVSVVNDDGGEPNNNAFPTRIGARGDDRFSGGIDEVELFGVVLPASDLLAIYNANGAGKCKPPRISSADHASFAVGSPGSFTVTTDPTSPAPALTLTGTLPAGVTFTDNGDGTATIAGTPAAGTVGAYAIAITANNGRPPNAVQNFTLVVRPTSEGRFYFATGSNGIAGSLYTVDAGTGAVTLIAPITNSQGGGKLGITGLAFKSDDNTLYGVTSNATSSGGNTRARVLFTINPSNGVATEIGPLNSPTSDISFRANDTLYGFQGGSSVGNHSLTTIDLTTGAATPIGNSGLSRAPGGGLAFSPSGTLYLSATTARPTGTLDTLDPATGARTVGPNLNGGPLTDGGSSLNAMAFDRHGTLFAANTNGNSTATNLVRLVTVNTTTGLVTDIAPLPPNGGGIAFRPFPSVQFTSSTAALAEGAGTVTLTVTRTGDTSLASSVPYSTSNGTATAGSDFTTNSGTLEFAAGETSKDITVSITNDSVFEPDETFGVTLNPPTNAALGTPATATITITDNDSPPTVQFSAASYTAGEAAGTATITVTKTGATAVPATVHYSTSNGTATDPADYTATAGDLTFAANETSKQFTVSIIDDAQVEDDETFDVTLSAPSGSTLGDPTTAVVTIGDNDVAPSPSPSVSPSASPSPSASVSPSASPTPSASPSPTPAPSPQALNLATRGNVQTGDNALISGIIVQGPEGSTKRAMFRAIGPSLTDVPNALQDPYLELYDGDNELILENDNWRETQEQEIEETTIPPDDEAESAIVATLLPGRYTAIMGGVNETSGVALTEIYDLAKTSTARIGNISTRGFVGTEANVLIGGFILEGEGSARVLLRGIGPSLEDVDVPNALQDPRLELVDPNGNSTFNDNWRDDQEVEITATTIPPGDEREAAILPTLTAGPYTVILTGVDNGAGVALVEIYSLQD